MRHTVIPLLYTGSGHEPNSRTEPAEPNGVEAAAGPGRSLLLTQGMWRCHVFHRATSDVLTMMVAAFITETSLNVMLNKQMCLKSLHLFTLGFLAHH